MELAEHIHLRGHHLRRDAHLSHHLLARRTGRSAVWRAPIGERRRRRIIHRRRKIFRIGPKADSFGEIALRNMELDPRLPALLVGRLSVRHAR